MKQTAKYCAECCVAFGKLPVYQQNEKQKEFAKASHFPSAGAPIDYSKLRTEMAVCEDCGKQKVVVFYLL
ncbi:MAG: hypothetical protein NDI90_20925 [Nitrospira sp. BO4]|nr:hypothetical protein [Nitrospira sp. BO4]